jgi:hypothetical protein
MSAMLHLEARKEMKKHTFSAKTANGVTQCPQVATIVPMDEPVEEAPRDPTVAAVIRVVGDDYGRPAGVAASLRFSVGDDGHVASAKWAQKQVSERWDLRPDLSVVCVATVRGLSGNGEREEGSGKRTTTGIVVV